MRNFLVILLLLAIAPCYANTQFSGVEHMYARLVTSQEPRHVRFIAGSIWQDRRVSQPLADVVVDVTQYWLDQGDRSPNNIIWLLRTVEVSRSQRYLPFIESLQQQKFGPKVDAYLTRLSSLLTKPAEETYLPNPEHVAELHNELLTESVNNPKSEVVASKKSIGKKPLLIEAIDALGYPDGYELEHRTSTKGWGVKVVHMIKITWDNRVQILYRHTGKGFKPWKANRVRYLPDLRDPAIVKTAIQSESHKDVLDYLRSIPNRPVPNHVVEIIWSQLEKRMQTDDRDWLRVEFQMCSILANAEKESTLGYLKIVSETAASERLREKAVSYLYAAYAELSRLEPLREAVKSEKPSHVRYAAKQLYSDEHFDQLTLDIFANTIQKNLATEDSIMANALAVMCRALGDSGVEKYREVLEKASLSASNKTVSRYAEKALSQL